MHSIDLSLTLDDTEPESVLSLNPFKLLEDSLQNLLEPILQMDLSQDELHPLICQNAAHQRNLCSLCPGGKTDPSTPTGGATQSSRHPHDEKEGRCGSTAELLCG
ncbi:hypothetical protein PAMP_005572 [Pampus punctatissimus]